jgi:succinyl-CoA synthetase alpha subunit
VSGSSGGGQAKVDALESVGVRVGRTPTQVSAIAMEILGG